MVEVSRPSTHTCPASTRRRDRRWARARSSATSAVPDRARGTTSTSKCELTEARPTRSGTSPKVRIFRTMKWEAATRALRARGGRVKRALRGEKDPSPGAHSVQPPVPRRPPQTAKASMFFDAFPRFYESSNTGAYRGRLNLRYEAIFGENQDLFPGARVIDIASHDGRWSLAALKAGAAEVTGIEAREDLVRAALDNVGHYYNDTGRYEFIAGDVFEIMSE